LQASKKGIQNLKFTYTVDPNIATQLDIILIKIDNTLRDSRNKLNYFKSFLKESLNIEQEPEEHIIMLSEME
jgi:hypothetical protein